MELETALRSGKLPARLAVLTCDESPDWQRDRDGSLPRRPSGGRPRRLPAAARLMPDSLPSAATRRSSTTPAVAPSGYRTCSTSSCTCAPEASCSYDARSASRPWRGRPWPKRSRGGWRTRIHERTVVTSGSRLPKAVDSVVIRSGHVALTNRRRAVAKLREYEMDVVLAERGDTSTEVLRLPPQEFVSRCSLRENSAERDPHMAESYAVPAMSLRVYEDVLCAPRQVAVQGNLALPDTFRFNAAPQLTNRFLFDLGPYFAPARGGAKKARRLEGTYFYLDSEWTKHFGHVVTEQLSRLWAVPEARKLAPDLKALLDRRNRKTGITSYELEIFGAAGFCESDITLHHRPVRVERLIAASPMWALPTHVHPDIADLWQTIGERVAARAPEVTHAPRIFLSRRQARRGCRNVGEVEALFATYGFEIVHPEDLPLPAQIKMFREAEVIAGFAGSGMFNMQFCPSPRHVIVLAPTSYPSRNEYMICAAAGHRLDYVWSTPDPEEVQGPKPQYAGFRFDFENEGVFLREVLDGL